MSGGTRESGDIVTPEDEAPSGDAFTPYDEAHMAVYLQLLYGDAEGFSLSRMAFDVFGIDAGVEPERAEKAVSTHLRRARWLSEDGTRFPHRL